MRQRRRKRGMREREREKTVIKRKRESSAMSKKEVMKTIEMRKWGEPLQRSFFIREGP